MFGDDRELTGSRRYLLNKMKTRFSCNRHRCDRSTYENLQFFLS